MVTSVYRLANGTFETGKRIRSGVITTSALMAGTKRNNVEAECKIRKVSRRERYQDNNEANEVTRASLRRRYAIKIPSQTLRIFLRKMIAPFLEPARSSVDIRG